MKDQLRVLDFAIRDPVRVPLIDQNLIQLFFQVENGHLFRLKTFTDRVIEARQARRNKKDKIKRREKPIDE